MDNDNLQFWVGEAVKVAEAKSEEIQRAAGVRIAIKDKHIVHITVQKDDCEDDDE